MCLYSHQQHHSHPPTTCTALVEARATQGVAELARHLLSRCHEAGLWKQLIVPVHDGWEVKLDSQVVSLAKCDTLDGSNNKIRLLCSRTDWQPCTHRALVTVCGKWVSARLSQASQDGDIQTANVRVHAAYRQVKTTCGWLLHENAWGCSSICICTISVFASGSLAVGTLSQR